MTGKGLGTSQSINKNVNESHYQDVAYFFQTFVGRQAPTASIKYP